MTRNSDLRLEDLTGCTHEPELPIVEDGEILHWICRCGKKVVMTERTIQTMNSASVYRRISLERERQETLKAQGKFKHTCADAISNAERLAILGEEYGEIAKEVVEEVINVYWTQRWGEADKKIKKEALRKELTQVAAVCVAWLEALEDT